MIGKEDNGQRRRGERREERSEKRGGHKKKREGDGEGRAGRDTEKSEDRGKSSLVAFLPPKSLPEALTSSLCSPACFLQSYIPICQEHSLARVIWNVCCFDRELGEGQEPIAILEARIGW